MALAGLSLVLVVVWTLYAYTAIPFPVNDSLFSWVRRQWLSEITVLLACAGFLSIMWSGRKRASVIASSPWWKAWLLWIAWSAVSVFYSIDRGASLRSFIAFASYGLLAFVAGELIQAPRDLRIWARFLVAVSVVACVEGLFQYFGAFKETLQLMDRLQAAGQLDVHGWSVDVFHDFLIRKRIFSFFGWPNLFAGFLLLTLPISLGLLLSGKGIARVLWLAVSLLQAACLMLTLSMGAWIAAVISLVAVSWLSRPRRNANPVRFLVVGALLLSMIWVGSLMAARRARSYITSSTHSRIVYVQGALNIIRHYPIQGTGIGTFGLSYRVHMPQEETEGQHSAIHAHNTLLELAAETGLVGLSGFCFFLWLIGKELFTAVRRSQRSDDSWIRWGLAVGLIGFFIHSLLEQTFFEGVTAPFWWLVLGLFAGRQLLGQEKAGLPVKQSGRLPRMLLPVAAVLGVSLIAFKFFIADAQAALGGFKDLQGNMPEAIESFVAAEALNPAESRYPLEAGRRLIVLAEHSLAPDRLKHYGSAKQQFEQVVRLSPWFAQGWYRLGTSCKALADWPCALYSFQQAVKSDGNARGSLLELIELLARLGLHDQMLLRSRRFQQLEPKDIRGFFFEALAWQGLKQPVQARACYERLLKQDPSHYASWFNLAQLRAQAGDTAAAAQAYKKFLEEAPMNQGQARRDAEAFLNEHPRSLDLP